MHDPFENDSELAVHQMATALVTEERLRQVSVKGHTVEHDDGWHDEQLAAAAAFYLQPAMLNPDVCIVERHGLVVLPLTELLRQGGWEELDRDDHDYYLSDDTSLQARIDTVVTGVSLGLAELERLLRLREKIASEAA